jgi:hypothetical protein
MPVGSRSKATGARAIPMLTLAKQAMVILKKTLPANREKQRDRRGSEIIRERMGATWEYPVGE